MSVLKKRPDTIDFTGETSRTKQSFKDDVDINLIIKKFLKTGQLNGNFRAPGQSMDLSTAVDFKTALNIIERGRQTFSSLSAVVRKRFDNDPAKFLEFMEDPKNLEEAIKLELVPRPKATPGPIQVEVVNKDVPPGSGPPPGGK